MQLCGCDASPGYPHRDWCPYPLYNARPGSKAAADWQAAADENQLCASDTPGCRPRWPGWSGPGRPAATPLEAALVSAAAAAAVADPGADADGGTCNFDSPAFRLPRARRATVEAAAKAAGVSVTAFTWWSGERWWWLNVTEGQGARRTAMAEAATRALQGAGVARLEAATYYAMD